MQHALRYILKSMERLELSANKFLPKHFRIDKRRFLSKIFHKCTSQTMLSKAILPSANREENWPFTVGSPFCDTVNPLKKQRLTDIISLAYVFIVTPDVFKAWTLHVHAFSVLVFNLLVLVFFYLCFHYFFSYSFSRHHSVFFLFLCFILTFTHIYTCIHRCTQTQIYIHIYVFTDLILKRWGFSDKGCAKMDRLNNEKIQELVRS